MTTNQLMEIAVKSGASDLHLTVAVPPVLRINGKLVKMDPDTLIPDDLSSIAKQLLTEEQYHKLNYSEKGELDFSFSQPGLGRYRVNIYKQRGSYGVAVRVINSTIPSMEELGLPKILKNLSDKRRGFILVTGPTGSGKSTTLACLNAARRALENDSESLPISLWLIMLFPCLCKYSIGSSSVSTWQSLVLFM